MIIKKLKNIVELQKKIAKEIETLSKNLKNSDEEEKNFVEAHLKRLKKAMIGKNQKGMKLVKKIVIVNSLSETPEKREEPKLEILKDQYVQGGLISKKELLKEEINVLEETTIARLKKKEKIVKKDKLKKPSKYVGVANKIFSNYSEALIKKGWFHTLEREITKANLQFILSGYVSIIFFTTMISVFAAVAIFLFFMFFNISAVIPIITLATEDMGSRFLKVFRVLFVVPILTFLIAYYYPAMERKSLATKINQELPFATIHMASISSSIIEPSKIFSIIINTKEYPSIGKEFTKIMNEINIYGYNLVSALRGVAFNCSSIKLTELLNSLATTITSGGELSTFFEKRSESLLFEHRLEREKKTKSAETFMDIYISVVIASPMILMLLLMMMKISGLGIQLSTSMITLIMILGVAGINALFLMFLQLRKGD